MSKVIKNGTIVTADRTWKADVLIEGETIRAIGADLKGDETIDATDAYLMPGGIDPHTHMEMPFMGTHAAETFESGTFAAASGGTTMLVDFVLPGPDGSILKAMDDWDRKSAPQISVDIGYHVAIADWNETIHDEMAEVVKRGVNTFKHFMAYKGALMIDDDEMFASFRRCAELGALLHATALAGQLAGGDAAAAALSVDLAKRCMALAETTEALHTDRAWRWLAPARALRSSDPSQAQALWRAGQAWLRTTAAAHVAPEFADGFLQHPLHQQLLAPAPGDPPRA